MKGKHGERIDGGWAEGNTRDSQEINGREEGTAKGVLRVVKGERGIQRDKVESRAG